MNSYPLIGISGSIDKNETQHYLLRCYMKALIDAGSVPVLLSPDMDDAMLASALIRLDGLFLAGGNDLDPALFGEAPLPQLGEVNPLRDQLEMRLIPKAYEMKMPVLGICRGIQSMNAAMGGTLWQDLPSQYRAPDGQPPMAHSQNRADYYTSHSVCVERGSLLYRLVQTETLQVNSFHHQAVRKPAPCLRVTALAADGVIEAVESTAHPFFLGVQWHPERYYARDEKAAVLFKAFAEAADAYQQSK